MADTTSKTPTASEIFQRAVAHSGGFGEADILSLIYVGAEIAAALHKLVRATNRQTAVLRTDPLEDRDLLREAAAEAHRAAGVPEDFA